MEKFWKIIRVLFYILFVSAFVFVGVKLFFNEQAENVLGIKNSLGTQSFSIVYPQEPDLLEPTFFDPTTRSVLVNIYEPLVKFDRDLKIVPALAVSWGLIDETTWQFRLRPEVTFHDGSAFDSKDFEVSFLRAREDEQSQLKGILANIESMEIIDDLNLRVKTYNADPLLLQKLAAVLVFPSEYSDEEILPVVGTSSYQFADFQKGDRISLKRFENYWGATANFQEVHIFARSDKKERLQLFMNEGADFLTSVPEEVVDEIANAGFEIVSSPTLEVQFLLFNFNSPIFEKKEMREAVAKSLDKEALAKELGKYVDNVNQFVSRGIFGFNPEISFINENREEAKKIIETTGNNDVTIQMHLPLGLDILGEHMRTHLKDVGINVVVSYLDPEDFLKSIEEAKADIYFLAFKSDIGDSADFLNTIVKSDGEYNIGKYKNELVDQLITSSLTDMNVEKRRESLQEAMRIITEQDIFGIPLFEYETVFAFKKNISFEPRIDGLIYFDELFTN